MKVKGGGETRREGGEGGGRTEEKGGGKIEGRREEKGSEKVIQIESYRLPDRRADCRIQYSLLYVQSTVLMYRVRRTAYSMYRCTEYGAQYVSCVEYGVQYLHRLPSWAVM